LRKEMEDIAFSYLDSEAYSRVKASIDARYQEDPDRVERIRQQVLDLLRERNVRTVGEGVKTNPRRVYDMHRRLEEELSPSLGKPKRVPPQLRYHVIVEDIPFCYVAMAEIHANWAPIASEIRDYITAPLPNGYQSLHTTVFIDEQPVKFQIRTMLMHRMSQLGIIAYMQEGELASASPELKQTVDGLRQFGIEAIRELDDPTEFLTSLKGEILGDEIYVYTPKHKVIQLAAGSTPIDFAFRIHTDIGYRCRAVLVDGHWVPLNRPLRMGERVEILTVEHVGPCFEWLDPDLGYTRSRLAKGKIRRWFRRRPEGERVILGRQQLRKLADRLSLDVENFAGLAKRMGYPGEHELALDIGGCDLPMERVLPELLSVYGASHLPQSCANETSSISIVGAGSLDTRFASCCRPQSGDAIVGYILAPGHTVEVHRSDCSELLVKLVEDRTRLIEVRWGRVCETFLACIEIYAHDRPFFLRDVWNIISEEEINVADVEVTVNRAQDATIRICIDVEDWIQFHRVLTRVEDLSGAISVKRKALPEGM
jgi:GTP pyrophosphokinase